MPHFDIIKEHDPRKSFRVASVMGTYDLQTQHVTEHFEGDITLPEKWNIGLIVGHSGTGKTTIARELFADSIVDQMQYTHESILDDMPKDASVTEICKALNSVGFSAPPSWLKPYSVLSNGEKMRCDIARAMLENKDMFVFDEFTSVVDRDVAQIGSFALQKTVRRAGKKFVAVTCHFDVQDWLMPDWIFNTDTMQFQILDLETQKKNRPVVQIDVFETKEKQHYWRIFRKYHYLNHSFNEASHVYLATVNGQLAGFCAVLAFPHPTAKNLWREHRTVILPDYQGVGIGSAFSDYIAKMYVNSGKRFISTTSNPAMIIARTRSKDWITTRIGRAAGVSKSKARQVNVTSHARITASFEYIGSSVE